VSGLGTPPANLGRASASSSRSAVSTASSPRILARQRSSQPLVKFIRGQHSVTGRNAEQFHDPVPVLVRCQELRARHRSNNGSDTQQDTLVCIRTSQLAPTQRRARTAVPGRWTHRIFVTKRDRVAGSPLELGALRGTRSIAGRSSWAGGASPRMRAACDTGWFGQDHHLARSE
jgi:hypothetical protein